MKRSRIIVAAATLALTAAACGGDDGGAGGTAGGVAVAVKTFQYRPNPAQVKAGQAVTWTNQDDTTHTVTGGTPGKKAGGFDGKLDGPGSTYSFTFDTPGTYAYFCEIHPSMTGEVTAV